MMRILIAALLVSLVAAQNCTSIFTSGNIKYMNPSISTFNFPQKSASLPASACGLPIQTSSCLYEEVFSCLVFDRSTNHFNPIDCKTAEKELKFPLCYGNLHFYADCDTFACCQSLNAAVLPYVKQQIGIPMDTSYYYFMQFYSQSGTSISCQSFSDGFATCVQNLNFYASSNWQTCNTFYNQFQTADAMAFNLF